jgi:hypothetical protein
MCNFFLFTHPFASSIITKIKIPTNIHRVPFFFFSCIFPSFHIFSSKWFSLFVNMTCHIAIIFSTSKYHHPILSCWKKKKSQRGFMLIVGSISAIVAASDQSYRCPNSGHNSQCRPKSPMSKSRPYIVAEVQVSVMETDVPIQAIVAIFSFLVLWCSRSNLNVCVISLGLRGCIETRVTRT